MLKPELAKQDFPIFANYPELIYLDSAATAHKPQAVIDSIVSFYTLSNANVHRGIYELSERATQEYEFARAEVAAFLGADAREIIFTSGTTASSNMIALGYLNKTVTKGDVLISSVAEHHSNFLPLQVLANKREATIELAGLDKSENLDYAHLEDLVRRHTDRVKVVALSAVSNVLGFKLDFSRVSTLVRKYAPNAVIAIDAAQLLGHEEFSLRDCDIDFLFFSGHKLMAETGVGVLWGRYQLLAEMDPAFVGGGMIATVNKAGMTFAEIPARFEPGTPHIAGAVSLAAAIRYLKELNLKEIANHHQNLIGLAISGLQAVPGVKLLGPTDLAARSSVVAFVVEGVHPHDVAEFLAGRDIAVRAGHHCAQILHREQFDVTGSLRASVHVYNSPEDIAKLTTAVRDCRDYFTEISQ